MRVQATKGRMRCYNGQCDAAALPLAASLLFFTVEYAEWVYRRLFAEMKAYLL